jgi:heme-degrading monooxygenase HmoA
MHLAQLNIARILAPLDDPSTADFVACLPEINALAERSPGFVWRLTAPGADDATALRPTDADDIMVNMSVWESIEALRDYTYRSRHLESLRRRREWFDHEGSTPHLVLWWIPAGHIPTLEEAFARRAKLAEHGPGRDAFTLRDPFPRSRAA